MFPAGIGEDPEPSYGNSPLAHLLRHDTVYGPFPGDVAFDAGALYVDGHEIPVSHERLPSGLPWAQLGADVVLECTGKFRARDALKVVLTAAPVPALPQHETEQVPIGV